MTDPIIVVGSGASGVQFARAALAKGHRVTMLDVGNSAAGMPLPGATLNDLKRQLPDPVGYFLGSRFESLILPGNQGEYYAFPPSKRYVFEPVEDFDVRADGFSPLVSFAAGGLAQAWTGGCYPFNPSELAYFPYGYKALEPYYSSVAENIGITGAEDDLAGDLPFHSGLMEPLDLDDNSSVLLERYAAKRAEINGRFGCRMGRARAAVLSQPRPGREACSYSGRCLWGCPSGAFYTPSITLAECRQNPNFTYVPRVLVDHLKLDVGGRAKSVVVSVAPGQKQEFSSATVVLAAGTLCTARILLNSIYLDTGRAPELRGLMDNRQILMPFVNLRMLGRAWKAESYQYHQIAMAASVPDFRCSLHGLVTTLKTALIHPLVQSLPFDLGVATSAFRKVHGALGMININLPDTRRSDNYITLDTSVSPARLLVRYCPEAGEQERLKRVIRIFRQVLRKLDCYAPSPTVHVRPMGASVHYAGTIPATNDAGALQCSALGRSYDFDNLYLVDGTTFPTLPAKNLTFTLMANAVRIATEAF